MSSLWPWLAVAGVGALHGLNPASGWLLAAAGGVRARDPGRALRLLGPIAAGHLASVALVAALVGGAVARGFAFDRLALQLGAGALLVLLLLRRHFGRAGLALWSFIVSTAHGAGLMLVPALLPFCLSDDPAREITASGSMLLALAAVGVHMAAMLAVTGLLAGGACRVFCFLEHTPRVTNRHERSRCG